MPYRERALSVFPLEREVWCLGSETPSSRDSRAEDRSAWREVGTTLGTQKPTGLVRDVRPRLSSVSFLLEGPPFIPLPAVNLPAACPPAATT